MIYNNGLRIHRESSRNPSLVLSLKAELDSGLDLWRKQVLSVQSLSILKAEERARESVKSKKEKVMEELKVREERFKASKEEKTAKQLYRITTQKQNIQEKTKKVIGS